MGDGMLFRGAVASLGGRTLLRRYVCPVRCGSLCRESGIAVGGSTPSKDYGGATAGPRAQAPRPGCAHMCRTADTGHAAHSHVRRVRWVIVGWIAEIRGMLLRCRRMGEKVEENGEVQVA